MALHRLRERANNWHNVIAPNSFRKRMARKLVRKIVSKYGDEIGAVYLVGSTASRRAMQDSSINMVVLLKPGLRNEKERHFDILRDARNIDQLGNHSAEHWYYSVRSLEGTPENCTAGVMQPEMEILHGKRFARSRGLPFTVRSREKRASYEQPKSPPADGAIGARNTNPKARKRTFSGLVERLRIERE